MIAVEEVTKQVDGTKAGYSMMECPHCKADEDKVYDKSKKTWTFDKRVNPMLLRYVCGKCKLGVLYQL